MNTLLIVTDENTSFDALSRYKLSDINIASIKNSKYLKHYLEEYMPSYLIIDSADIEYEALSEYAEKNNDIKIFIFAEKQVYKKLPQNFFILRKNNGYIEKTIKIISDLEREKREKIFFDSFKFLNFQIIPVISFKGGSGKTTFAFNTAFYLKRVFNKKVLLVDLNFYDGPSDLSCCLDLNSIPNLSNYIVNYQEENSFNDSLTLTPKDEIDILLPPLSIKQSRDFDKNILKNLIEAAEKSYDFMILDVPEKFDDIFFEVIDAASLIINMVVPEEGCIRRAAEFIKNNGSSKNIINIMNYQNQYGDFSNIQEFNLDYFEIINFKNKREEDFISFSDKNSSVLKLEKETKRTISRLWENV